jgi:hypothetical protein
MVNDIVISSKHMLLSGLCNVTLHIFLIGHKAADRRPFPLAVGRGGFVAQSARDQRTSRVKKALCETVTSHVSRGGGVVSPDQ